MTQDYDGVLNERAQLILRFLVEAYIRDGQPVGSRALSKDSGLALSSATIRNVMADLEELGFVISPHTSAGRVPTDRAYRFFVDTILTSQASDASTFGAQELGELKHQLESFRREGPKGLPTGASQLLSNLTGLAGVVTLPNQERASITHIDFIGLSDNRVLAILVFDTLEVQNRVIQMERHYSADELRRAANYLNDQLAGRSLTQARDAILAQLQDARATMNELMLDAISVAQKIFDSEGRDRLDYVIAGETHLMGQAQLNSVEKLRRLFEAFNEKRDFLNLLDQSLRADGVQIFIGRESGYGVLDDCSVITAPYSQDNNVVGVIGVIGPTRMAYERVIPLVDVTAKLLGAALNSRR